MALKVCGDCTTAYAADLDECPHCQGGAFRWDYEEPPAPKPAKGKTAAKTEE